MRERRRFRSMSTCEGESLSKLAGDMVHAAAGRKQNRHRQGWLGWRRWAVYLHGVEQPEDRRCVGAEIVRQRRGTALLRSAVLRCVFSGSDLLRCVFPLVGSYGWAGCGRSSLGAGTLQRGHMISPLQTSPFFCAESAQKRTSVGHGRPLRPLPAGWRTASRGCAPDAAVDPALPLSSFL